MKEKVLLQDLHANKHQPDRNGVEKLAEAIKAVGLIEPIVVSPDGDGFAIVAGHRRVEAVRGLGWTEIDAIILEGDEAMTTAALLTSNMNRQDFSELEVGQLAQTLFDLEQSPALVADLTGMTQKHVKQAAKTWVETKDSPTVHQDMSLDEAAVFALCEDEPELLKELEEDRGTDQWEHTRERTLHVLDRKQQIRKLTQEAEKQGLTIIEQPAWDDKKVVTLDRLCPSGVSLDEFSTKHAEECEGHACYISTGYDIFTRLVCTDAPTYHDYKGRERSAHEEADLATQRAGRAFKKEGAAPTEVRREFVKVLLAKGKVKNEWLLVAKGIAGRHGVPSDLAYELIGKKHPGYGEELVFKTEQPNRKLALAMVIAYYDEECRLSQGIDHWRAKEVPFYLSWLRANGYVLSPHELQFIEGVQEAIE